MTGRFVPRATRPTGTRRHGPWRIKWYEITLDGAPVPDDVQVAAADRVSAVCEDADPAPLGVGFAVIHRGTEAVWLLLGLWSDDILTHRTWSAPLADPSGFELVPAGGPTACVWELVVHGHERDALVRHVLDPATGPAIERYLDDVVNVEPVASS